MLIKTAYYVKIYKQKRYNLMVYEYKTDIHIEYPFYQRMAGILKGKKSNSKKEGREIYEVECPCCHKRNSYLYTGEKGNTFMFKCFLPECQINSLPLHQLIKEHGGDLFDEWRKARWTNSYYLPIKNRVPYEDRAPRKKKTFREKQELQSSALQIKMNGL